MPEMQNGFLEFYLILSQSRMKAQNDLEYFSFLSFFRRPCKKIRPTGYMLFCRSSHGICFVLYHD